MPNHYAIADSFRYVGAKHLKPILDVLVPLEWPYPNSDLPGLVDQLGWVVTTDRVNLHSDTRLPLNWTLGNFSRPDGELVTLGFPVSDAVDDTDSEAVRAVWDAFPMIRRDIESLIGPASGVSSTSAWWELDTGGRLRLDCSDWIVMIRFLSKRLAEVERFEETHDLSEYDAAELE